MRKTALRIGTLTVIACLAAGILHAQDKPAAKPAADPAKPSSTDEELLKDLVPGIPLGGTEEKTKDGSTELDELDRTITSMRQVGKRLNDGDTSDATRDLQAGILQDIDALIKKLKKQPPPNPNQNSPQDQSPDNEQKPQHSDTQSKPKTQPKPTAGEQPSGKQPTGSGAGQKQENKNAGESTEENRQKAQARETALARRRALINEVWGHLPPALREKLLNVGSEKLLPQYEELIRRYYESLADSPDSQAR